MAVIRPIKLVNDGSCTETEASLVAHAHVSHPLTRLRFHARTGGSTRGLGKGCVEISLLPRSFVLASKAHLIIIFKVNVIDLI